MGYYIRFWVVVFFSLLTFEAYSQIQPIDTRAQLETQKKQILSEITESEKVLVVLRDNKKATFNQLMLLKYKLNQRQQLIDNIGDAIDDINNTMHRYAWEIAELKRKLKKYKTGYTQSIRYSYEARTSVGMLAYLISSGSYNESVRRMKYLHHLRLIRKLQADKIKATHSELYKKIDLLNAEKTNKTKLLAEQLEQNKILEAEKRETDIAIKDITTKENEVRQDIEKKKKSAKRVSEAIKALIEREMATQEKNEEGKEQQTKTPSKGREFPTLSNEDIQLAYHFEKKKGKLPCPVELGTITCHFGKYNIKNIEYFNNGMDIQTVTLGVVGAVADGVVSGVTEIDGKTIVLIQHGIYFSVYNNLSKATVIKGEKVTAKSPVGVVANNDEGLPTLNFQIWKVGVKKNETTVVNPEPWLKRF